MEKWNCACWEAAGWPSQEQNSLSSSEVWLEMWPTHFKNCKSRQNLCPGNNAQIAWIFMDVGTCIFSFILIFIHVNSFCDIPALFFHLFFLFFTLFFLLSLQCSPHLLFQIGISHILFPAFVPSQSISSLPTSLIWDYFYCTEYNLTFLTAFSTSACIIFKHFSKIHNNRKELELSKVIFQD